MLKNKDEIRAFIMLLFGDADITINGKKATPHDLIVLCVNLSNGKENIKRQNWVINAGRKGICVETVR